MVAMTIILPHLNSVAAAGMIKVLDLPVSSSPRQVVSILNIRSSNHSQYYMSNFQFSSTFQSRSIAILPTSYKQLASCSYNCCTSLEEEEEEDYNKNNNNIAITSPPCPPLYDFDRMGGSLSSSSSLSSSPSSCSCNSQNASPLIQINIVFPHPFQFWEMLTHVYSKLHHQLIMFRGYGNLFFFQVAVSDKERALRKSLNKIAENGDTSTLNGPNYVLKEVVKALLQYSDSSIHFTKLIKKCGSMKMLSKMFKEFLNKELERHGKDQNTLVNVDDNVEFKNKASMVKANSSIENEYTVVTLLVLASGKHLIPYFNYSCKVLQTKKRWCYDCFQVLRTLQRIPQNEIQSVEVLWSPRKEDTVLLEDELVRYFPALIWIDKGLIYSTVR